MSSVEIGAIHTPLEDIFILNLQSGELRPLDDYDRPLNPAWTPNPDILSFDRGGVNGPEIVTLNLASDRLEVVANGSTPSWSPDGNYLALVRQGEAPEGVIGQPSVFVLNLTTREQRLVFEVPEAQEEVLTGLSWSLDSSQLALSAEWWTTAQDYTRGLYVVGADGKNLRRLSEDAWFPGWMPGGTWLYFLIGDGQLGFAPLDFDCMITPLDITNMEDPVISPSGDRMAFVHNDNIYLLDLEQVLGANREKLTCREQ